MSDTPFEEIVPILPIYYMLIIALSGGGRGGILYDMLVVSIYVYNSLQYLTLTNSSSHPPALAMM